MINSKQTTGKLCEALAESYLQFHNLKPITKNYHCKYGEIDLIMLDIKTLVFVEVRSKKNYIFGHPIETINAAKKEKLINSAHCFIATNPNLSDRMLRFDAVTMKSSSYSLNPMLNKKSMLQLSRQCDLKWYKNIISF